MLTKNDELMLAACKEIDDAREWINRVGDLDVARHCYPADNATFASNTAAALTFLLSTRADGDSAAMQKTEELAPLLESCHLGNETGIYNAVINAMIAELVGLRDRAGFPA